MISTTDALASGTLRDPLAAVEPAGGGRTRRLFLTLCHHRLGAAAEALSEKGAR